MSNPRKYIAKKERVDPSELDLSEKVVFINRVAKVMKGGRRFHFTAVVVVGRKPRISVPMTGSTIPPPLLVRFRAAQVLMKPAPPGTGLIAGGGVRAVLEMAGVKDAVAKSLGSNNPANAVKATMLGLSQLRSPEEALARRRA